MHLIELKIGNRRNDSALGIIAVGRHNQSNQGTRLVPERSAMI